MANSLEGRLQALERKAQANSDAGIKFIWAMDITCRKPTAEEEAQLQKEAIARNPGHSPYFIDWPPPGDKAPYKKKPEDMKAGFDPFLSLEEG